MKKWENAEMICISGSNRVVRSMKEVDFSELKMPMIVVFEKPVDFPDKYIARVFECEQPTNTLIIRDSLQECREDITAAGFLACLERTDEDALAIVETWMK